MLYISHFLYPFVLHEQADKLGVQEPDDIGMSSGNNQINVSNRVIDAGDGWRKGWGAAIVMLHQVWQMSDNADSAISVPALPKLSSVH